MSSREEETPRWPAAGTAGKRNVDLVMRDDIALGLARPRKLPRDEPEQRR